MKFNYFWTIILKIKRNKSFKYVTVCNNSIYIKFFAFSIKLLKQINVSINFLFV